MKKYRHTAIALSVCTTIVIPVWTDCEYGLIRRRRLHRYGCESHITFNKSDTVTHAGSYDARSWRVDAADQRVPVLQQTITQVPWP
jgi:thiamine pyrophosphate-dependent acetolactate synthase large subunit-like protein